MSLKSKMLSSLSVDRSIKYLGNNDTETEEDESDIELGKSNILLIGP